MSEPLRAAPFLTGLVVQLLAFLSAWLAGAVTVVPVREIDFEDPAALLSDTWQVSAAFASVALAGLAVMFQIASEPVVGAASAREVLFRYTGFKFILAFAMAGCVQIGAARLFLLESEPVVIEFFAVSAIILAVGVAYARAANVFATPGRASVIARRALMQDLDRSMRVSRLAAAAQNRIERSARREWAGGDPDDFVLVSAPRTCDFQDIFIEELEAVVAEIARRDLTIPTGGLMSGAPSQSQAGNRPTVVTRASFGSRVKEGDPLFVLTNSSGYGGDVDKLARRLNRAIRWSTDG